MKQNYIFNASLAVLLAMGTACKPEIKKPKSGQASGENPKNIDFTKYYAFGNSLTSGYADGALYREGQLVSYPNLLAQQLKSVGLLETFTQPLMPAGNGLGIDKTKGVIYGKRYLKGFLESNPDIQITELYGSLILLATTQQYLLETENPDANFNNMGVPGISVADVDNKQYGTIIENPYYYRMLKKGVFGMANLENKSYMEMPTILKPSFFTVWLGANDVLSSASEGEANPTPQGTFESNYTAFIDALFTANSEAHGVLITVPDITLVPYFTTLPYNALALKEQKDVDKVNGLLIALGVKDDEGNQVAYKLGANPILIKAATPGTYRVLKPGELTILPTMGAKLGQIDALMKNPPESPLELAGKLIALLPTENDVLDLNEKATIQDAVVGYNNFIKNIAQTHGDKIAVLDVIPVLQAINKPGGIMAYGVNITAGFVSGGAFSLDGLHLTPRGNAYIANELIRTINEKFGTRIPQVVLTSYAGVLMP
jgi:lysophospholipase L1-like esterase